MGDTFTSTLNVAGATNLFATASTAPTYTFDISGTNGVNDTLVIGGSASLTSPGAKVSINALGALTVGNSYTLISGGAGSNLATNGLSLSTASALRVVGGGNTYSVSLANTATTSTLTVNGILSLYWSGSQNAVWNTSNAGPLTNWNTDAASGVNSGVIPTSTTDVYFNTSTPVATNLTNTLGADTSIYSLNYSAASGAVVIGAGNNLTLGVGGLTNLSSSTQTINAPIVLGSNQAWTNSAGATLTVPSRSCLNSRMSVV